LLRGEAFELALFGGDYISESPRYAPAAVNAMSEVMGMATIGGAAVLGNHDLNVSTSRVQDAVATVGIPVLRNDVTVFSFKGSQLAIAGIDETLLGEPHPHRTMQQVPVGVPALALWHEPEFAELAADEGAFAQLSGHTHGGQIRVPGIGPVGLPVHGKKHVIGLDSAAGMPIYTSRGVGVYRPPARFNCPPEVTLVTLRAVV
jgi:predicted MPP superfamily phosphohydrolase